MKYLFFVLAMTGIVFLLKAQPLKLIKAESAIEITGTSSLHDWKSTVDDFTVEATLAGGQIRGIDFAATVKSIKSGKSGMDNNTYKALREDEYPKITFVADQLNIENNQLSGKGQLTIAGESRHIPIDLVITQKSEVSISGSIMLKMTDYGIPPPTAVFGTIKTGDKITIQLDFTLTNN